MKLLQENIVEQSLLLHDSLKKYDALQIEYHSLLDTVNEAAATNVEDTTLIVQKSIVDKEELARLKLELEEKNSAIDDYETRVLELLIELDELKLS